jgi:peptide/nickel transport system substrate-binding protein
MKILTKYKRTAQTIAQNWKQIGVKVKIEEVDTVPKDFQLYVGDFNVPKDPDQYTLWHTGEINNITKFSNLRIDKLLEDGRKTVNQEERLKIYFDFQKYLIDESPASFLYFPYEYEFVRK